jgi:hypothetical protein
MPEAFQGRPGMAATLRKGEQAIRLAGFRDGGRQVLLLATTPSGSEVLHRCFDSLRLLAPGTGSERGP